MAQPPNAATLRSHCARGLLTFVCVHCYSSTSCTLHSFGVALRVVFTRLLVLLPAIIKIYIQIDSLRCNVTCRLSFWQESVSFWEQFFWGQMLLTQSRVALPSYQLLLALLVCSFAFYCKLQCFFAVLFTTDMTIAADLMMIGMMVVLLATGLWLALATFLELPVSTSHSVGQ